jgi:16S rRNA (guanine(966)-N(2))-methyltransferase RsmD
MRVISGTAKGRKLKATPGAATRPITDKVKEALFNIIDTNIVDARFLDLFAGTGGVGIEALSRGARQAVFVDKSRVAIDTIRFNLEHTRLSEHSQVIRADAFAYLAGAAGAFEYIFVAPPQYQEWWLKSVRAIDARPAWLAGDGEIIVQIDPHEYQELALQNFEVIDERRYGNTMLVFYARPQDEED